MTASDHFQMQDDSIAVWFVQGCKCMVFRIKQFQALTNVGKSDASAAGMFLSWQALSLAVFDGKFEIFAGYVQIQPNKAAALQTVEA